MNILGHTAAQFTYGSNSRAVKHFLTEAQLGGGTDLISKKAQTDVPVGNGGEAGGVYGSFEWAQYSEESMSEQGYCRQRRAINLSRSRQHL